MDNHKVDHNEALAALVKQLPLKLRTDNTGDILDAAVAEEVIGITDDGRLAWLMDSKTLLAYFVGRTWCGDKVVHNDRTHTSKWVLGDKRFPEKDVDSLFCVRGLRNLRGQRELRTPPCGYEAVEALFDILTEKALDR